MNTAFAVSTDRLALGVLDQKIHSRPPISEEIKKLIYDFFELARIQNSAILVRTARDRDK
jgi:hypothetical protein